MVVPVIRAYGNRVTEYVSGRPDYPDAILSDLPDAQVIVDLAAGTGKFTRLLSRTGAFVIAVEPLLAMAARVPIEANVRVVAGTAEQIPLAGATADLICCATAFHWFDYPRATAEILRVLKPGAHLALIWNVRDNRIPWVADISALFDAYGTDTRRYGSGQWRAVLGDARFANVRASEHPFAHRMPVSGIVDRVLSTSFIAALTDDQQEVVRQKVLDIIRSHPELTAASEIEFPYIAQVYLLRSRA